MGRSVGYWVGGIVLALSGCAHTEAGPSGTTGQQPVATATNPQAGNTGQPQAMSPGGNNNTGEPGAANNGNEQNANEQNGTAQNGTAQNGTAQNGTAQNGTAQNGTAQNGNEQNQTGESATNENAAPPSDAATPGNTPEQNAGNTANVAQQRSDIISDSDGSQPGVIQTYSYGELTIAPPAPGGAAPGPSTVLSIPDNVPVFQGDSRISTNSLVPGTDVRVYYKNPISGGSERQVIGVDVLKAAPQNPTVPNNQNQTAPGNDPGDQNGT